MDSRRNGKTKTTWNRVAAWYSNEVGEAGHFYHQSVILPVFSELLSRLKPHRVLDLACGQGVLERILSQDMQYTGVDIAPELIAQARKLSKRGARSEFLVLDASKPVKLQEKSFDLITCVLALQNIENFRGVFDNCQRLLREGGEVVFVLNHPMFRIPRSTGWGVEPGNGKQYRWVSAYLREQKIPITMNPGAVGKKNVTWSFHVPLCTYVTELSKRNFALTAILEPVSGKESQGKFARRENTARNEIPLFMILVAKKLKMDSIH